MKMKKLMEMEFDMSDEKNEQPEIKEYADGWITEKKGTDAPIFLKIAYIVISLGCVSYLFIYIFVYIYFSNLPLFLYFPKL